MGSLLRAELRLEGLDLAKKRRGLLLKGVNLRLGLLAARALLLERCLEPRLLGTRGRLHLAGVDRRLGTRGRFHLALLKGGDRLVVCLGRLGVLLGQTRELLLEAAHLRLERGAHVREARARGSLLRELLLEHRALGDEVVALGTEGEEV